MDKKTNPTIHDLYPDLTPDELKQAEENIDRYLSLILRIFERTELELENGNKAANLTADNGTLVCTTPRSQAS